MKGNMMNNLKISFLIMILILLGGCMKEVNQEKEKSNLLKTDIDFATKSKEI
jgi:hypothetical protein